MKTIKTVILILFIAFIACNTNNTTKDTSTLERYWSTLDSSGFSLYLGGTIEKSKIFTNYITVDVETDEVLSDYKVDAADDPAIWYNSKNTEKSLILGTNKKGGVHVYNMNGDELQYVKAGCINNIDLRDNFEYNRKEVVLVAASNCTLNSISLFYIDKETNWLSDTILNIKSEIPLVYGTCMYRSNASGKYYVFLNGERGDVEQWEIYSEKEKLKAKVVRRFMVSSRPEGMVADDKTGMLYIGVEEEGILKVKAEPENKFETIWVNESNPSDKSLISSDIEGIGIFNYKNKTYLIASSQGNFSFPIFEIGNPDKYITSFVIKDGEIDGAEETDGLDIVGYRINETFPKGMMVVQDGYNFIGDSLQRQNFKYISLEKIIDLIEK